MRPAIYLTLTLLLSGCDLAQVCTTEAVPGISITVLDSVTNARPQADPVTATASDGAFVQSEYLFSEIPGHGTPPISLAHERAGRYRVTVHAAGYHPWERDNVLVRDGECHVRTAELRALLQPL